METNSILPTSPNQTRQFLLENEEILFIGSAKEKYNHLNIIERTRWIALTDQGRLLIMYTPDTKTSDSVSNSPQLARASFRDGKRPLMGSRRSSIEHKPEDIVPKSPAPLRASFSAGFKRRLSIKDTSNEKESSYPEDLVDDQDVPHTPKSRRASFRASFQRKSATLPSITPAAPTKSGESSAVISRDASFLIEEENVYVTYGTKIHKAMVINQFDQQDVFYIYIGHIYSPRCKNKYRVNSW